MTDETQVNMPVPDAPDQATPVTAVTPDPGPSPKPRRRLGAAGQVVGIAGFVLSLVLAAGSIAGVFWLTGQVNDVAATVDARLAEGQPKLDTLAAKVGEIKSVVDEVVAVADSAAQATAPEDGLLAGLTDRLNGLAGRYANLRNAYADLREKVTGALSGLQLLERVVPGFSVPQEPIQALQGLDARIQELDGSISGLLDTKFDGSTLRDAAAAVSEKVGKVSSALESVLGLVDEAGVKLAQVRTDVAAAISQLTTVITLAGILMALLFVYVAFLHWVLFRTSRAVGHGA
jgi:hypothetical protein